jgi:hypothetical protein
MTLAEFIAFAQARHGEQWIKPMAEETGYAYHGPYNIVVSGMPVSKRLAIIVSKLPKKPPKPKKRKSAS